MNVALIPDDEGQWTAIFVAQVTHVVDMNDEWRRIHMVGGQTVDTPLELADLVDQMLEPGAVL